jgi:hypothetical protein
MKQVQFRFITSHIVHFFYRVMKAIAIYIYNIGLNSKHLPNNFVVNYIMLMHSAPFCSPQSTRISVLHLNSYICHRHIFSRISSVDLHSNFQLFLIFNYSSMVFFLSTFNAGITVGKQLALDSWLPRFLITTCILWRISIIYSPKSQQIKELQLLHHFNFSLIVIDLFAYLYRQNI